MPPIINDEAPKDYVRPYEFHGVNFTGGDAKQRIGDCPFCGREGKFSVSAQDGKYRCWVCGEGNDKGGGNIYTFIRHLSAISNDDAKDFDKLVLHTLAKDRGILYVDTLIRWQVAKSAASNHIIVPGYSRDKKLCQLYQYVGYDVSLGESIGKRRLLPTPTLHHGLHGVNLFDAKKDIIYLCEGFWDGTVVWETLSHTRVEKNGRLVLTKDESKSLLNNANVLAVPGCTTFSEQWLSLFEGKHVIFLYDSDHPTTVEMNGRKRQTKPAGYAGMLRAIQQMLLKSSKPPSKIEYLPWGEKGYDPSKKSGWDVRDELTTSSDIKQRVKILGDLLDRVKEVTPEMLGNKQGTTTAKSSSLEIEPIECKAWVDLEREWKKAMKWIPGLSRGLACMISCVVSTNMGGDQLWFKMIGPPSCGKSTLCEAINIARKYVLSKSGLTGFHSGFKSDRDGEKDNSIITLVNGKCLVIKDGDTLLKLPNLEQVLSEARDLYDCNSRKFYRHGVDRNYEGIRMTWILCGTSSLRSLDSSELGARFLDCVIMEDIDDDLEDDIIMRAVHKASRSVSTETSKAVDSHYEPDMLRAMQMTGGYINYLRENMNELMAKLEEDSHESLYTLGRLAKFTAYMRARPSTVQDEKAEREIAARLAVQLTRLAKCLAVVLNRKKIDDVVLSIVKSVALDTSRGIVLNVVNAIHTCQDDGIENSKLAILVSEEDKRLLHHLRFLRKIGVCEAFIKTKKNTIQNRPRWRLTEKFLVLYEKVMI